MQAFFSRFKRKRKCPPHIWCSSDLNCWKNPEISGVYTTHFLVRVVFGPSQFRVGQEIPTSSRVLSTRWTLLKCLNWLELLSSEILDCQLHQVKVKSWQGKGAKTVEDTWSRCCGAGGATLAPGHWPPRNIIFFVIIDHQVVIMIFIIISVFYYKLRSSEYIHIYMQCIR